MCLLFIATQERDIREADGLCWFLYSTDRTNGGGALCRSYHEKRPIRIFRSSLLGGRYAPPFLDVDDDPNDDSDVAYRYDGLYMVRAIWNVHGHETETYPVTGEEGWQTFFFTRAPKKPLEEERREEGMAYNFMSLQELWSSVQKMKGARRPKRFEIPPPPVKLPALNRTAISGVWKDRKSQGFKKPEAERPPTLPPKAKKAPRKQQSLGRYSSDSDSDTSQQLAPISARTPAKVVNARPRLNSVSKPKKASSAANDESDSSDSESSTSDSPQKKRKKPSFYNSAFFPKRASAARCEAANRDMAKRKRKSSEKGAGRQTSRAGGRKRKAARQDDSSSSSEDEQPEVEQSIITVGSRVLVAYKGDLFKSTIRKRREKNGQHDFLIHYDGNKRTNVHWIPLDRIKKILEINLDTRPKTKQQVVGKKKGKGAGGKRKAPATSTDFKRKESLQKSHFSDAEESDDDDEPNSKRVKEESGAPAEESLDSKAKDEAEPEDKEDDSASDDSAGAPKPAAKKAIKKARVTVVSEVSVAKRGKGSASANGKKAPPPGLSDSDSESDDSSASSAEEDAKSKQPAIKFKYPVGGHVYVEYRKIFYSSTILQARRKRTATEYLVHYEGYKKSSNRWVKESALHAVNTRTTKRYEEQHSAARRTDSSEPPSSGASARSTKQKKAPPRRMKSDASELSHVALDSIDAGVDFLVGSMVFVEWSGGLYLAKMLKKRYSGDRAEYRISYDGYKSNHDAWVSIHKIYEINHQTKRAFKRINSETSGANEDKPKRRAPAPGPRRETRKKAQDNDESDSQPSRASSRAQSSRAASIDMEGIEPGVDFLPGSTIFAQYKSGLCLAKMVKKRGKGDYMEYFIQYSGLKKEVEAWVSTALLWEINPQTKRMFRKLAVKK